MATITEDYVSFEVAKLLKKKGFDEKCLCYYEDNTSYNEGIKFSDWFGKKYSNSGIGRRFAAPTQQMAMKWLREVHNIHIVLSPNKRMGNLYGNIIFTNENGELQPQPCNFFFGTYEQACEAAIKYCLENLIK